MVNEEFKAYIFAYLDMVRESGAINMFEGSKLIQYEFGLDRRTSRELLIEWMKEFPKNSVA
jgi:hypothetical protein